MHERLFVLLGLSGCSAGLGASTAATRPLLGQTITNDDAKMWVVSDDQHGVPDGLVRIDQVSDGFARVFDYVSITSGVAKGNVTAKLADGEHDAQIIDLHLSLWAKFPLPVGGFALGAGHVWALEDNADLTGWAIRASVAPIAQLSVDLSHAWVSGSLAEMPDGTPGADISGTRTTLGGTVLLWGMNSFRFGISIAKVWTSAGDAYQSHGYTYSLVSTMY